MKGNRYQINIAPIRSHEKLRVPVIQDCLENVNFVDGTSVTALEKASARLIASNTIDCNSVYRSRTFVRLIFGLYHNEYLPGKPQIAKSKRYSRLEYAI